MIDYTLELSDAQAVTASAESTNSIDLGAGIPDLGGGADVFLVVDVSTAFATCDSITVSLQDSANDSSFAAIASGPTVLVAAAIIGKRLALIAVPQENRRYLRAYFTIAGSSATAGAVNAYLTTKPPTA